MNELFFQIEKHLLIDKKPSEYINQILKNGELNQYPFSMIKDLESVDQNPKYHPEGNVFIHTMMVVDTGAQYREKSKDPKAFMWSLLLHDVGKKPTTKIRNGKLTSYNHDIIGSEMAEKFLRCFLTDEVLIKKICSLVRWHMQMLFVNKSNNYKSINKVLEEADIDEILLVCLCDRLGRGGSDYRNVMKEINNFKRVLKEKNKDIMN